MRFEKDADGSVRLIGEWESPTQFALEFLEQADERVKWDGKTIEITVSNGWAVYEVVEHNYALNLVTAELQRKLEHA